MKKYQRIIIISGLFLTFIIIVLSTFFIINNYQTKLGKLGYSKEIITKIKEYKITGSVMNNKYSKTLEEVIKQGLYKSKYLIYYLNTIYTDDKDYFSNLEQLITLSYNQQEINKVLKDGTSKNIILLSNIGYFKDEIDLIITKLLPDQINEILANEYLQDLKFFLENDYQDNITDIIALQKLGYSKEEVVNIYTKLNKDDIKIVLNYEYNSSLLDYLNISYFKIANLSRYLAYQDSHQNFSLNDIVKYVNLKLDYNFYDNIDEIVDPSSISVLVNKYHMLPSWYEPNDLKEISSEYSNVTSYLRYDAALAFEKLCADAYNEGFIVKSNSAYRSNNSQNYIYWNYVSRDGRDAADTYSARPGHSEHETGLAVDVSNSYSSYLDFEYTSSYSWMENNAYKYGFILRYPSDKTWLTGYTYESWHYRYVGVELATILFNTNQTLDEYWAVQP